jgi:CRISPR-associated endonuclease Csn1
MRYVLGLDIGVASIGWAAINVDDNGSPVSILSTGSRIFPAGKINNIEKGEDVSRNQRRRDARSRRRQLKLHRKRLVELGKLLQSVGFLPHGNLVNAESRMKFFETLDATLGQPSPYALRAKGLDTKLEKYELGRALYQLAQRRGFLSTRARPVKDEEETGVVRKAIAALEKAMAEMGARTLGEYLSKTDERIRARWTSRRMYIEEFDFLWKKQSGFHPELTPVLRDRILSILFYQKPISSQKHRVGACSLEPTQKRMSLALLDAQRFRFLQRVNDLRFVDDQDVEAGELTREQRDRLIAALDIAEGMTFDEVRTLLGLPRTVRFNLEEGGEKRLVGNRTAARLRDVVGAARWATMTKTDRDKLVQDVRTIEEPQGLFRRGVEVWKLSPEDAERLTDVQLESGYLMHSAKAVVALLPQLVEGVQYATAKTNVYQRNESPKVFEQLPPLLEVMKHVTNPLVTRALTEVRTVVNAIIRAHGKPDTVRLTMNRLLLRSTKLRQKDWIRSRIKEKARTAAVKRLFDEMAIIDPHPSMVDKVILADECKWVCPFTGKPISMRSLVGGEPTFYVTHIVPFAYSLDDSLVNKTLCHVSVQRSDQFVAEMQGSKEILKRVGDFDGPLAKAKARRFNVTRETAAMDRTIARVIEDSSYATKAAADYVGLIYGGRIDPQGSMRVFAVSNRVIGYLRSAWGLGRFDVSQKIDHRSHAMHAICVALTTPSTLKSLATASTRVLPGQRRRFVEMPLPWETFADDSRVAVESVIPSFRVDRPVSGPLHEETYYSLPKECSNGKLYHLVRKPLVSLSPADVARIDSPTTKAIVMKALEKAGTDKPRKAFAETLPTTATGRVIRAVKVRRSEATFVIGEGVHKRHVVNEENHHLSILENDGKWTRDLVSLFEAQRRMMKKEPVVRRGPGFVCSLAVGEIVTFVEDGVSRLLRVRSVSKDPRINFVLINDARPLTEITDAKALRRYSVEQLRLMRCQKVTVDPLGRVRNAND